jgi:diacylglycerol kinase (ATP)
LDNWVLIANPAAGGGRARKAAERAARFLERKGQSLDLRFTRAPGHAGELAHQAVADGAARLIACGGDGTIIELLPALAHNPAALGLLPAGTSNDFARALGIPRRLDRALDVLLHGQIHKLDLGRVQNRLFCTVAAFGFDAEINHAVNSGQIPLSGTPGYIYAAFKHLSAYRPPRVCITGEFGEYRGEILLVASGNTHSYGGGMRIVPAADPQDGKLDICIAGKLSRCSILKLLPRVFSGGHINHPAVRCERTSWLKIETDEPRMIYADGEHIGETPAILRSELGALAVVLPGATLAS